MAIDGNPKKMAEDISNGLISLNKAVLKKYTPADLKMISNNLTTVQREIRSSFVDQNDFDGVKLKNQRMQRINQALLVLRNYCKVHRYPI